jgi:hypothetical protein
MNGSPGGESQPHSFEIPQPQPSSGERLPNQDAAVEKAPLQEGGPSKEKAAQLPAMPVIPQADPVKIPVITDDDAASTGTPTSSTPAADTDRIEQVWVDKAKKVIAMTLDDPYKQKSEMGKVKAEYIKKRFNKSIPTDDTVKV